MSYQRITKQRNRDENMWKKNKNISRTGSNIYQKIAKQRNQGENM